MLLPLVTGIRDAQIEVMKEKQNATEPPPPSNNASPAKKIPRKNNLLNIEKKYLNIYLGLLG